MFNFMLDRMPTEYNGYLIRTSFRIGVQISLCLQDEEFNENERLGIAANLLFGNGEPDNIDEIIDALNWFLNGGAPKSNRKAVDTGKQLFYWDFDSSRLYSSFMQTYNIDLNKEDMHWFKFLSLVGSLDKNCAFNKAIEIRDYDMSKLDAKSRNEIQKMKSSLTPEVQMNEEEEKQIELFNSLFDGGDVNG